MIFKGFRKIWHAIRTLQIRAEQLEDQVEHLSEINGEIWLKLDNKGLETLAMLPRISDRSPMSEVKPLRSLDTSRPPQPPRRE